MKTKWQKKANQQAKNLIQAYKPEWVNTPKHSFSRKKAACKAYVCRHLLEQNK